MTVDMQQLSDILWRERELLELLVFKLDVEEALAASGRTRWAARAAREVDLLLDEIRRTEVLRALRTEALAAQQGRGAGPTLEELTAAAPEPWSSILAEHRCALLSATAEVGAAERRARRRRLLQEAL